jgi:hypothetical protein
VTFGPAVVKGRIAYLSREKVKWLKIWRSLTWSLARLHISGVIQPHRQPTTLNPIHDMVN